MHRRLLLIGECILLGGLFGCISGAILTIGSFGILVATYFGTIAGLGVGVVGAVLLPKKRDRDSLLLIFLVGCPATVLSTLLWPGNLMLIMGVPIAAITLSMFLGAVLLPNWTSPMDLKCETCSYDLRGSLASRRCPECGRTF